MKYYYLLVNLGAISIPFLFSFHPKLRFDKIWKAFFPANILTAIVFIAWDILYTSIGVWGFNEDYLTGSYVSNLPIEEVLFFFCIPYACVFTWYCFQKLLSKDYFKPIEAGISTILTLGLLCFAALYYTNLYTAVTFVALGIFIFVLRDILNIKWMSRFYFTYLILLLPFTIVNGILTGWGLENPIVWYNSNHHIGIRMLTIPIEDIFYGMLLILMNISLFEYFRKKFRL